MDTSAVITVVLTVLAGLGAGVLSALLGVGGAVVTTPAVRVLGATPIQAVGSTVPAILPGAVAGTLRYAREGLVDWRAALGLGISGSVVAVLGALASHAVQGGVLMVLTAVLMVWSGLAVARGGRGSTVGTDPGDQEVGSDGSPAVSPQDGRQGPPPDRPHDGPRPLLLLVLLGGAAGFVAGLLGVGGGVVIMPVLTGPLKIPMKAAVASSLVAVAIFSVPTLITHTLLGDIDWAYALPLMVGVVPGARIGAHITIGASERTIRRLFGVVIIVVAVVYGAAEMVRLVR